MGFMHIQVPGYGHMTIEMYRTAIFDDPEVVQIDPVRLPVLI